MKTLMANLENLGFTKQTGLSGLSLNNIAVSLHWSEEAAVVSVNGKQVFNSESEEEVIAFVEAEIAKNKSTQELGLEVVEALATEVASNKQVVKYYNDENDFGKTELIKDALICELPKSVKISEFKEMVEAKMNKEQKIEVTEVEYNDDLVGFIAKLKDGRIVQVQFEKETNRLHADFGTFFPVIDKENDYGFDLSGDEEDQFKEWMSINTQIQNKIKELDADCI